MNRRALPGSSPQLRPVSIHPALRPLRDRSQPGRSLPVQLLQRTAGNRAVERLVSGSGGRSGLAIGQPGDGYEKEAERVADTVMRMTDPAAALGPASGLKVQRCGCGRPAAGSGACTACNKEEEDRLQRSETGPGPGIAPPIVHDVLRSSGEPLDSAARAFLEPRLGWGLGDVRVHRDAMAALSAEAVEARAYTVGRDVIFARGAYSPYSDQGRWLLAHELAHVRQQEAGSAAGLVQRFTTSEHTEIGNLAFDLARRDLSAVGPNSPLRSLLVQGSRFRWGERVKVYGDLVADGDFFDTFSDFIAARGERATGFSGQIDLGRLATRNLPHFSPHNIRSWVQAHDFAVERMLFAYNQLAFVRELLRDIDPLLEGARRAILAGQDQRAERLLGAYRARFEPVRVRAERIIPAARRLAWEALLQNAFAEHYLTDAFSAGHIVTPREEILRETGVDPRTPPPSRAGAVRGGIFPTWSELGELRAQARSLAWHDLDNFYGIEVAATDSGFAPWTACGDQCSQRTGDSHWQATRAMAIRANAESIKHLWQTGLTGVRPVNYRSVLDLLPRPTWRNYPGWSAKEWRNQLKYIRGEGVSHVPGTQLPDIVATVLWPVEHCVELEAGCAFPFVGTRQDWIERWSFTAWVQPWINRVKASAAARYDYASL